MIKIQRKVYDENGTETVLGLPCKTVTDYWNGEIAGSKISIEDAFDIESIDIVDDHSTDVLQLLNALLDVKLQERLVPTGLEMQNGYLGPVILSSGEIYYTNTLNDNSISKIDAIGNVELEGIPIVDAHKCFGDTSYCYFGSNDLKLLLDNKTTTEDYTYETATDLVFGIVPKEYIVKDGKLTSWAKLLLPNNANPANCDEVVNSDGTVTNNGGNMYDSEGNPIISVDPLGFCLASTNLPNEPCYNILFYTSKNYMNKILGVTGIAVGIGNTGLMSWLINAYNNFGIPYSVLMDSESDLIYLGYPTYNGSASTTGATTYHSTGQTNTFISSWFNLPYETYVSWYTVTTGSSLSSKCNFYQKYFKPSKLPTGFRMYVDDKIWVYINGKQVLVKGSCPNTTVTMDFSSYINLNEVNSLCVMIDNGYSEGSGGGFGYFGFI